MALVWVVGYACAGLGATIRVPADHAGLQEAIDASVAGDIVLAAPGEYRIDTPLSFRGKEITLRSEGGPETTVIRMRPRTVVNPPAPASVVVFETGEGERSVLEGFTLTGGSGVSGLVRGGYSDQGGGVLCLNGSSPSFVRCVITGNSVGLGTGGGLCCLGSSSPRVIDCSVSGNSAYDGGGLYCSGSSPILLRTSITGNSLRSGGGVYCTQGSAPTFTDCTISDNVVSYAGGGVYCEWGSSPVFRTSRISGNSASFGGGVHSGEEAAPSFIDCTITGNSSDYVGGVHCAYSAPSFVRCRISGNVGRAGGVLCWAASPTIDHCTISGNVGSGISCQVSSSPLVGSSIIWENSGGSIQLTPESTLRASFSTIESEEPWPGEGVINRDPLFCGWTAGAEVYVDASSPTPGDGTAAAPYRDLHAAVDGYSIDLQPGSPCLGTGAGGTDMGAGNGPCPAPGSAALLVHLGPGTYRVHGVALLHHLSLDGAGEAETVLEGTVESLETGAVLSRLSIRGGTRGGVVVGPDRAPELRRCTISSEGTGVFCGPGSRPVLSDCKITSNPGGGLYCTPGSAPVLEDCLIAGNWSYQVGQGGGVFCASASSPSLKGCTITGNAAWAGGGIYCAYRSTPVLQGCTLRGNAAYDGGALACENSAAPLLRDCIIEGNSARHGGGVYAVSAAPLLFGCSLRGNSGYGGGGIYHPEVSGLSLGSQLSPSLVNCLLSGNRAARGGGAIEAGSSAPRLVNCTLHGNAGEVSRGTGETGAALTNCIVWGNSGFRMPGLMSHTLFDRDPSFERPGLFDFERFSEVTIGNFSLEPQVWSLPDFEVDPGDYHLRGGSPAIDAADPAAAPTIDLEGKARPCGPGIDVGALEYGACPPGGQEVEPPEAGPKIQIGVNPSRVNIGVDRELLRAFARDADGNAIAGAAVEFVSEDEQLVSFPQPRAFTDSSGIAYTVIENRTHLFERREHFQTMFLVSSGSQLAGPFPVIANPFHRDGLYGFSAPPLKPFNGPEQKLLGTAFDPFQTQPGVEVRAWSIDPTVAEISAGRTTGFSRFGEAPIEFTVTARRTGTARFIIGTVDYAIYASEVTGRVEPPAFRRGDSNSDGTVDVSDPIWSLSYLFVGGDTPPCLDAADSNDDGGLNIADAIHGLTFLFADGPSPPAPGPRACGVDPTADRLACEDSPGCPGPG